MPVEQLICKKIAFSNTSNIPKDITVESDSEYIVIKHPQIHIAPRSSELIQLRMLFPRI